MEIIVKKVFADGFNKKTKPVNKNKRNLVTGIVVLAFALIGVITVISLIINLMVSVFDDTEKKQRFEDFIAPVVMVDPVAFSDVKGADEHVLLMASMWNLLMNIGEDASYPEDEYGMMVIPASDLEVSAASLFGSDIKLSHQTFGNTNISFEYDSEKNSYIVPPMGYTVQYQPRVDKIKRKGKTYTLTVAYISSNTSINRNDESEPDKYMYYILEKVSKDKYIIKGVKDSPNSPDYEIIIYSNSGDIAKTESDTTASSQIAKTESEISSETNSENQSSAA